MRRREFITLLGSAAAWPLGAHAQQAVGPSQTASAPLVGFLTFAFSADGGLISYGPDQIDQWRGAAVYVNRILKGEKPSGLPVQTPTKYELAINLRTAKTLGMTVPPSLIARAERERPPHRFSSWPVQVCSSRRLGYERPAYSRRCRQA
jgi:hypothetical protein